MNDQTQYLIAKRQDHKTAHVLHFLLSLVTFGLWVPIWIIVALSHRIERGKIDRKLKGG